MKPDACEFRRAVCEVVAAIPAGMVATYGQVACLAGWPSNARMVGRVLSCVGAGEGIPCHRVVGASGRTAPCWPGQAAALRAEGVAFRANGHVDMKRCQWDTSALLPL